MYVIDGGARYEIISHVILVTTDGVRYYTRGRRNRIGGGRLFI